MPEPSSPEVQKDNREGRIFAVLGTLGKNSNVRVDAVNMGIGAAIMGAATGNPELALLGVIVGSFARMVPNILGENGRRSEAVRGDAVDRTVRDSRHLIATLVAAVRSGHVQMPTDTQMNPDSIRADRIGN